MYQFHESPHLPFQRNLLCARSFLNFLISQPRNQHLRLHQADLEKLFWLRNGLQCTRIAPFGTHRRSQTHLRIWFFTALNRSVDLSQMLRPGLKNIAPKNLIHVMQLLSLQMRLQRLGLTSTSLQMDRII